MRKKSLTIKINIKEDLELSEYTITEIVKDTIKQEIENDSYVHTGVKEVIRDMVVDEAKKHKKQLANTIAIWIKTMDRSELFYRDRFRGMLIEVAKKNEKKLSKRVGETIEDLETSKIYDALGFVMADKFIKSVRNNDNY